jgi:hypothetical protein
MEGNFNTLGRKFCYRRMDKKGIFCFTGVDALLITSLQTRGRFNDSCPESVYILVPRAISTRWKLSSWLDNEVRRLKEEI